MIIFVLHNSTIWYHFLFWFFDIVLIATIKITIVLTLINGCDREMILWPAKYKKLSSQAQPVDRTSIPAALFGYLIQK